MGSYHQPQAAYVGVRLDSIGPAHDPPLSFGVPELAEGAAYVERRQDLEPPRQGAAKFGRINVKPRKDTPTVALDPPSRNSNTKVARATVGVRKDSFSPALDPPSRFPAAGAHALDSLSKFPAGPFGPYPNHVPPPSSMNRGQSAEVRYKQDKDEGCGCVIL